MRPMENEQRSEKQECERAKSERRSGGQDKRARHDCRVKPMSAHGFLQHVENRHRAAEICKLLMVAEISRVIYAGVRLNTSRIAGSRAPTPGAE